MVGLLVEPLCCRIVSHGVMRGREFLMKDAYSFDADAESLDRTYQTFYKAYERIFRRCGIPFLAVEAESGPMGGSVALDGFAAASLGAPVS